MGIWGAGVAFSVSVRRLLGGLGLSGLLSLLLSSSFGTSSALEVALGVAENVQNRYMSTKNRALFVFLSFFFVNIRIYR